MKIPEGNPVIGAKLFYITSDDLKGGETEWTRINRYSLQGGKISIEYPDAATFGYVSVVDLNGSVISTEYMKL